MRSELIEWTVLGIHLANASDADRLPIFREICGIVGAKCDGDQDSVNVNCERLLELANDHDINKETAKSTITVMMRETGNEWPVRKPEYDPKQRFKTYDLNDFCNLEIKEREYILDPIIQEKSSGMLYAIRGTGKTHVGLGIAFAVATGTKFLKWTAPKPRNVLLIDGEMPAAALKERLNAIIASTGIKPERGRLTILAGDLQEHGIGNLADPKNQKALEPELEGIDLLILDNLSSLTAVIRDNDPESWNTIQAWLLHLRRKSVSVLIIHHAGKGGEQRGTSRREDILDVSIKLCRPPDYDPSEGARFEVHIEKGRGIHGDNAKPFEAQLITTPQDQQSWVTREIADLNKSRVAAMLQDDMSVRDISDEIGLSKSVVHRLKKQIEEEARTKAEAAAHRDRGCT